MLLNLLNGIALYIKNIFLPNVKKVSINLEESGYRVPSYVFTQIRHFFYTDLSAMCVTFCRSDKLIPLKGSSHDL